MSHAAFWKAICAEPDDDTPRLVYADWLDEQGDPASVARAEFIRTQIELESLESWTGRRVDLMIREQQLLQERREEWLERLPQWIGRPAVRFRRGLPDSIYCRTREYLKNAGGLAKNTPIQELCFSALDPQTAEQMARVPGLARLRALHSCDGSWALWTVILASPHLKHLRQLCLPEHDEQSRFHPGQFTAVFQLPALRKLERLHLAATDRFAGTSASLLRSLAEAPFTDLRELDLTAEEMHPQRVAGVLNSPITTRLASFRTGQYLDDHSLGSLVQAREIPTLKSLAFAVVYASQGELPAVFGSHLVRSVESLEIRGLRDEGFRALAASPIAEQLRVLALPGGFVMGPIFRAIMATQRLQNLLSLTLDVGRWKEEDVSALAYTFGVEQLRHLRLGGLTRETAEKALHSLASSSHWPNLRGVTILTTMPQLSDRATLNAFKAFAAKYADRFAILVA